MALSRGMFRDTTRSRFFSHALSTAPVALIRLALPYKPDPLLVNPAPPVEAEAGLLGMLLASLDNGTEGFARSKNHASRRASLRTTLDGLLYDHGLCAYMKQQHM